MPCAGACLICVHLCPSVAQLISADFFVIHFSVQFFCRKSRCHHQCSGAARKVCAAWKDSDGLQCRDRGEHENLCVLSAPLRFYLCVASQRIQGPRITRITRIRANCPRHAAPRPLFSAISAISAFQFLLLQAQRVAPCQARKRDLRGFFCGIPNFCGMARSGIVGIAFGVG